MKIWYVQISDYEASWPLAFFDSEAKATAYLEVYNLKSEAPEFEQSKRIVEAIVN
jgi:hypothetical protein